MFNERSLYMGGKTIKCNIFDSNDRSFLLDIYLSQQFCFS